MANNEQNRRKFLTNLGFTAGAGILSSSFNIPKLKANAEECNKLSVLGMGPYAVMQVRLQIPIQIFDLTAN